MHERLNLGGAVPARGYADPYLISVVQQYYELPRSHARAFLSALAVACLRAWCGEALVPEDARGTQSQSFWLEGPERLVQLWVRFTDPHLDVIVGPGPRGAERPEDAIVIRWETPETEGASPESQE